MKKIYHYTDIESFRSILANKTIRLKRLDSVDDPEEWQSADNGINPAEYTFVSCWTKEEKEMQPQWRMYGAEYHGVRIALDADALEKTRVSLFRYKPVDSNNGKKSYQIFPGDKSSLLYDIKYVDDRKSRVYKEFGRIPAEEFRKSITNTGLILRLNTVCLYKSMAWSFQKECRFCVSVFPGNNKHPLFNVLNGKKLEVDKIDVKLKPEVVNRMEVVLGPCVTEEERERVKSIMMEYLGRMDCVDSQYTGQVKEWGYLGEPKYFKDFEGQYYKMIAMAEDRNTLMDVVVYQALSGDQKIWTMPKTDFFDGRVTVRGTVKKRFVEVTREEAKSGSRAGVFRK